MWQRPHFKILALMLAGILLTACDTLHYEYSQVQQQLQKPQQSKASFTEPQLVRATGYAPISLQPGQNQTQQMLNAMKASKLQAYKELAAVVHGQYLFGSTQVQDMVVQSDQFNTAVGGIVRGARVVKTYPVQDDAYATILELDMRDVQRAYTRLQP